MTSTMGERVADLRRRRGWTQSELAEILSLSHSYVSLIESDRRQPSGRVLATLADRLGCTVDYLATGRGPDDSRTLDLDLRFAELALRSGAAAAARDRFAAILDQARAGGAAYRAEAY